MEQLEKQPDSGGLDFNNPPESMESLFSNTSSLKLPEVQSEEQPTETTQSVVDGGLPNVSPVGEDEPKPWDFSEEEYRKAEDEVKAGRGTPETSTRATLGMIKYGWPRLLGAISKTDWRQYRPDPEEEKDLYNAFYNYYEATGKRMNPVLQLVLIGGMYLVATGWQAYDNYQDKAKVEKAKERSKRITQERSKGNYAKANEMASDASDTGLGPEILSRTRFQLSSKGTYQRTYKGKYITGLENQTEYPLPEIKEIIERMESEGATEGEVNNACREYLKELQHGS